MCGRVLLEDGAAEDRLASGDKDCSNEQPYCFLFLCHKILIEKPLFSSCPKQALFVLGGFIAAKLLRIFCYGKRFCHKIGSMH